MAEAPAVGAAGTDIAAGKERVRSTAKWTATSFGAVAAALLAGLQLTSLHDATGHDRTLALLGFAMGIAGVLLVMVAAAWAMTAGVRDLDDISGAPPGRWSLRYDLNQKVFLRHGYPSVAQFLDAVRAARNEYLAARLAASSQPRKAELERLDRAIECVTEFDRLATRTLSVAGLMHLRRVWSAALGLILVGACIAAVGSALFAVHAKAPDEKAERAVAATPVAVSAGLTSDGLATHRAQLGATCRRAPMHGYATASDEAGWTVLITPTANNPCGPASIVIAKGEGSVKTVDSVPLR